MNYVQTVVLFSVVWCLAVVCLIWLNRRAHPVKRCKLNCDCHTSGSGAPCPFCVASDCEE